jgi:hypothetical protein
MYIFFKNDRDRFRVFYIVIHVSMCVFIYAHFYYLWTSFSTYSILMLVVFICCPHVHCTVQHGTRTLEQEQALE